MFDLSIILNVHAEGYLLQPTLHSLNQCCLLAKKDGISIELVCVQNSVSKLTKKIFDNFNFTGVDKVLVVETTNLSLGLARNRGIESCSGEFVWTADGDDLVSENAIVTFFEILRSKKIDPNRVVLFPEFLIEFGSNYSVFQYLSEPLITYVDFAFANPYVSRIFSKRKILLECSYNDLQKFKGFAFEDWDLNNRLKQKGLTFNTAPNVILFYRKRPCSLLQRIVSNSSNVVNNSGYFNPQNFFTNYRKSKSLIEKEYRRRLLNEVGNFATVQEFVNKNFSLLQTASHFEPDIDFRKILASRITMPVSSQSLKKGIALARLYAICGSSRFSDVVILPFLKAGGGEKYIISVLNEIKTLSPDSRFLVITGESCDFHEYKSLLPKDSTFVDIYNMLADFTTEELLEVAFRLIINVVSPKARLHLKVSPFANSMIEKFGVVLSEYFVSYYYRFSDSSYSFNGECFDDSWGIDFIRNNLDEIDYIISDSKALIQADTNRLGDCSKYRLLRNLCNLPIQKKEIPLTGPLVFLWASRISHEKRLSLLPLIAKSIEEKGINCRIDVWGGGDDEQVREFKSSLKNLSCISYKGAFENFLNLPLDKYSALIYTSYHDGTPNVILEAMSQGLPVIAPNIGGIPYVVDDSVGYLLSNNQDDTKMSHSYVCIISKMNSNKSTLIDLSEASKKRIQELYSRQTYSKNVNEIFFLGTRVHKKDFKEYR